MLSNLLEDEEVLEDLKEFSCNPKEIGTHSMRKGAATYCASGSTECPSAASIHLRAGWTLGGVQDTYLRYEKAGDYYVGRTVCGLPVGKPEFAICLLFSRRKVPIL